MAWVRFKRSGLPIIVKLIWHAIKSSCTLAIWDPWWLAVDLGAFEAEGRRDLQEGPEILVMPLCNFYMSRLRSTQFAKKKEDSNLAGKPYFVAASIGTQFYALLSEHVGSIDGWLSSISSPDTLTCGNDLGTVKKKRSWLNTILENWKRKGLLTFS